MGSTCCKDVRVIGIPQQEPINVNNVEELYKNATFSVPLSLPKEFNAEKNNTQHPDSDEENTAVVPFRPQNQEVINENDLPNDRKRVVVSQFPPIQRQKHNTENEQQQRQRQQSAFSIYPLSKRTGTERISNQTITVRLPPLQKLPNFINDDKLVESVSTESHSDNVNMMEGDWRLQKIPDGTDFYRENRFFTSTPIPPSPERSNSDDEYVETLDYLSRPLSNNIDSNEEYLSIPPNVLQILQLREQINLEEYFQRVPIPDLKLSSEHLYSITNQRNLPMIKIKDTSDSDTLSNSFDEPTLYLSNTSATTYDKINTANKLEIIHSDAFDATFNIKRQQVIENNSYRLIIEAWRPNSIEQLVDQIKNFSTNKPTIDRLWLIFYWIARNIEYDTIPYVGKKHVDKSAEAVFRTRKAVGDGYANLFKRLCDDLDITCEKVHGYSKAYIFDSYSKSSVPIDHTWNAVQINQYWYLVDLTCCAGYLDDNQVFKRELNSYYFLTRPNEMIYHHFPAIEQWQLLKQPIKMAQYMQMPKLWPKFFQLDLQLINPNDTIHVDLDPGQSYAMVQMQAPRSVSLIASFTLKEKEVDGGNRIVLDSHKRLYRCYFAPASIGVHIIRFFVKDDSTDNGSHSIAAELELDIRQMPSKPISFPKTSKLFFELNLEIICPHNTHLIKMNHGDTHTEILIRAPSDVEIAGRLTIDNSIKVPGGDCTSFDRRNGVWRCSFAPHRDGLFEALILAKRRLDPGTFAIAARFKIKAKRIPIPPLSYPKTWQLFHDLDLQVEVPRNSATVMWPEYGSYAQVCIRTPDDVRLMGCIERNGIRIENGSLTQFNSEKQHWQLFFAPEQTGEHKLLIFSHCSTVDGAISGIAAEFQLNVTQLRHSIKFPVIYTAFLNKKCRIYEPMDGVLKRNAPVFIHCEIPNARQVDLTIDSKWVKTEGYQNSILKRQIMVGSREVIIYAKYDENTIYNELIKYTVQ